MKKKDNFLMRITNVFWMLAVLTLSSSLSLTSITSAQTTAPSGTSGSDTGETSVAQKHYLKGNRLYLEGRYEEAAEDFRQAHRLSGEPLMLYNLANAYERMGEHEKAIDALRRYAPSAPAYEHDTITRRIRNLEQRVEESSAAEVGSPASQQKTISEDPASKEFTKSRPRAGYALLGTGAALVGVGIGFAVAAKGARDDAKSLCENGFCRVSAKNDIDRDRVFSILADTSLIAGGVGLIAGIVLIATHDDGPRDSEQAARTRFNVGPTKGGASVSLSGRF